jgi:hypothetical protein
VISRSFFDGVLGDWPNVCTSLLPRLSLPCMMASIDDCGQTSCMIQYFGSVICSVLDMA